MRYEVGDEVQIEITDRTDPDHRYHGNTGEIVEILEDDLGDLTESDSDSFLYTVRLDNNEKHGFRYEDLSAKD
jgi:ribosomal protein L21E